MTTFLVVLDIKTDRMGIMTREEREYFLELYRKMNMAVPTIVIARFDDPIEAVRYTMNIKIVDDLINNL